MGKKKEKNEAKRPFSSAKKTLRLVEAASAPEDVQVLRKSKKSRSK